MGFFNKIGSFFSNGLKKLGEFGSKVAKTIGVIKPIYEKVNGLTGGLLGKGIESIPYGIGDALKMGGQIIHAGHGAKDASEAINNVGSHFIGNARQRYGGRPAETTKERDQRRYRMGIENI